jgi:hypothetical protein
LTSRSSAIINTAREVAERSIEDHRAPSVGSPYDCASSIRSGMTGQPAGISPTSHGGIEEHARNKPISAVSISDRQPRRKIQPRKHFSAP